MKISALIINNNTILHFYFYNEKWLEIEKSMTKIYINISFQNKQLFIQNLKHNSAVAFFFKSAIIKLKLVNFWIKFH